MRKIKKHCAIHGTELDEEKLEPGLHAVNFRNDEGINVWGLIYRTAEGDISAHYNVDYPGDYGWSEDKLKKLYEFRYFKTTRMEKDIWGYYQCFRDVRRRWLDSMAEFDTYRSNVNMILRHPLHRLADRLITFFS